MILETRLIKTSSQNVIFFTPIPQQGPRKRKQTESQDFCYSENTLGYSSLPCQPVSNLHRTRGRRTGQSSRGCLPCQPVSNLRPIRGPPMKPLPGLALLARRMYGRLTGQSKREVDIHQYSEQSFIGECFPISSCSHRP